MEIDGRCRRVMRVHANCFAILATIYSRYFSVSCFILCFIAMLGLTNDRVL